MRGFGIGSRGVTTMAVMAVALGACQSPGNSPSAAKRQTAYAGTLPQPSPVKVNNVTGDGDYVHKLTGLTLPATAGRLKRIDVVETDEAKDDVGANYRLQDRADLDFTALIFPIWNVADGPLTVEDVPAACQQAYAIARNMAQLRLRNWRKVSEAPLEPGRFADATFTQSVVFDADGGDALADFPIRSELHVYCGVDKVWVVQYRMSYAPGIPGVDALIKDFMARVPAQP
jgi:hypothetical protein